MKNDDPLRAVEEWTGHRSTSLIPTAAAILLTIGIVGFLIIASLIASNLIAKP